LSNDYTRYATSPYNFIPFPKQVVYRYDSFDDLPTHNIRFDNNLLTGVIDYSIKCITPLFISDGNEDNPNFFNINDEYMIPGSTLRGRIRTNSEILSHSYPEFIEDQKLWFRGLADKSKKIRNEYEELLKEEFQKVRKAKITDFVKAGYLIRTKSNKYEIIKANEDDYGNSFKQVPEVFLRNKINNNKYHDMFMFEEDTPWGDINDIKQNKRIQKFQKQKEIGRILKDYQNNHYKPYFAYVDYSIDSKNHLLDIKIKDNDEKNCGMLMNSSSMGSKQNHYLVFKESSEHIEVSNDVIDSFSMNVLYQQKNKDNYMPFDYNINSDIDLRNLPNNVKVPVFYKLSEYNNNNKFVSAIGFTPYMKLPFKYSILDGIDIYNHDYKKIDYANAIYGFTNKEFSYNNKKSYKGRVYFENARLENESKDKCTKKNYNKILSNPKITAFQMYINQENDDINRLKTYNDIDFKLRGYKFYWLKEKIYEADKHLDQRAKSNMKIQTRINALMSSNDNNLVFKSKIHFKNLTKDELGLLLYSIRPFEDGRENIGQGKPFGFGQVELNIDDIHFDGDFDSYEFKYDYTKDKFLEFFKFVEPKENIGLNEKKVLLEKTIENFKQEFVNKFNDINSKETYKLQFNSENNTTLWALYESKSKIIKEKDFEEYNYMNLKDFKERKVLPMMNQRVDENLREQTNLKDELEGLKKLLELGKNENRILSPEEDILFNSNIYVISNSKEDEEKLRKAIKDFKRVEYILIQDLNRIRYNSYDLILFNNLDGQREENKINNTMAFKKVAYLYFNDKNVRLNLTKEGYTYSYASVLSTVRRSIIDLLIYRKNIEE
jgi:CRISPR-associated protein (TIGR03986 family)